MYWLICLLLLLVGACKDNMAMIAVSGLYAVASGIEFVANAVKSKGNGLNGPIK